MIEPGSPIVTVVLPTRDRKELVHRALASVTAQTFTDFECVVVDDGSVDGTAEALRAFHDPRVTVVRSLVSRGAPHARNVGIGRGRGRYVAFLDDDDEWLPHHLVSHVQRLQGTRRLVATYSAVWIDRNGTATARVADTDGGRFERLLAFAWPITTSGIVVDRVEAGAELHFDENLPAMQELEL
ncbi:MAG: glycosyltransferase family A protein, partial [Nitriliruptorales bacterium]|nr:glycosyltransferase family A protein [Nitriliruptorales bacterium]